jgi:hypothetical protein
VTGPAAQHNAERIQDDALVALVERRIRDVAAGGLSYIRNPAAFQAHLLDVARRSESVARRLRDRLPPGDAPDPTALFVAGAWHDAGKISAGEDYHEITSAIEVLEHGAEWELVRGSGERVDAVLRRAARAILPGFALYEQCRPEYSPTWWNRARLDAVLRRLDEIFGAAAAGSAPTRGAFLPSSIDDLVLMYADMDAADDGRSAGLPFAARFERRWSDVEIRAKQDDPALYGVLHEVRSRVYEGCALVESFLTEGYDPVALARFRERHSRLSAPTR